MCYNTLCGVISREYRKTLYSAPFILEKLKRLDLGAVISSDCHGRRYLDCAFEGSAELIRECGFKERYVLTKQGFEPVSLRWRK